MKDINILSLVQAHESLKDENFKNFLKHYGIEIKHEELKDLKNLVDLLYHLNSNPNIFSRFYVGYKIPQIGKEFDLLRFGEKYVINIELKKTSTEEKIKKQLIRNKYYLGYTEKPIHNLSYVSDTNKLYVLNNDENLEPAESEYLKNLLTDQKLCNIEKIDNLFNPSDYLVSPFNSTHKFLDNQYFLTNQQEEIKNKIINSLLLANSEKFISVIGSAGTGKTLLVYDITRELIEHGKNPLIIHCGYLNEGQEELKSRGWNIIEIKNSPNYNLLHHDVVIIDEAQRIYPTQLDKIIEAIKKNKGSCIFSYDKLQTLAKWEEARDIDAKIKNINQLTTYGLTEKIRTNKEIANFIKMLFNNKNNSETSNNRNIEVNYFQNTNDAKNYLISLDSEKWEVLRFTPSKYTREHHESYSDPYKKNSHKVIGQEFDGVVVTIDKNFTYDENGKLIYNTNAYYYPAMMLFQNITRARKRVNIVIIDNEELLNRCISILQNSTSIAYL